MRRIGIISDTHNYWDDRYEMYMGELDEIWHAGDICSTEVADRLKPWNLSSGLCVATAMEVICDVCTRKCYGLSAKVWTCS